MKEKSIAILPFLNMSSDGENEYFCDGITEEIIDALAQIPELQVTSRTSSFFFKKGNHSLSDIAEKLQVNVLIEGSIRIADDQLKIKAKAVEVDSDQVFWSETWDRKRNNLFHIQEEVSTHIAEALREQLGHLNIQEHLTSSSTKNIDAYDHYLQAKFHFNQWNPEACNLAITSFEKAIEQDSEMVEAHLGLADSYSFMAVAGFAPREEAYGKMLSSIAIAKAKNPEHPKLNYILANQAFFTEADYGNAMHYALKAQQGSPTDSEIQQFLAFLYVLADKFDDARKHLHYAKAKDPLNPETLFYEAYLCYREGEYQRAETMLLHLLELNEKNLPALVTLCYVYITLEEYKKGQALIQSVPEETFNPDELLGLRILLQFPDAKAEGYLTTLIEKAKAPEAHHAHTCLYVAYVRAGQFDLAFEILEKLFDEKSSILLLSFGDPMARELRLDDRFKEYHHRIYKHQPGESKKKMGTKKPRTKVQVQDVEKVKAFMAEEKPYLDPSLNLRSLAGLVDMHPNHLSALLNEFIGLNFNKYVNQQRIEHFKMLLADSNNHHISIIGLAYESGFNSKTVFNTAFKKEVGMTPKAYQMSIKA